jgi:hypothetical protein
MRKVYLIIYPATENDKDFIFKYLYLVGYDFKYHAEDNLFLIREFESEIGSIQNSISEHLIRKNIDFAVDLTLCQDGYAS